MNRRLFTLLAGFSVLLLMLGCQSAQDKLLHCEQELLTLINQKDYYQVQVGKKMLKWPLPPMPEQTKSQATALETLALKVKSIDKAKLSQDDVLKLDRLINALDQMSKNGIVSGFDPLECVLPEELPTVLTQSSEDQKVLLFSSLQAYYQEVEKRWSPTSPDRAYAAASNAVKSYDMLSAMDAPESTLLALKDFIALCRSTSFFSTSLQ